MNKKMLSAMTTMLVAMMMSWQSFGDAEVVDGIEWTYTITDGEATVGDNGEKAVSSFTSGAITIPSTLGKCPVTHIGDFAFWYCRELTGITIPEGIKSIGANAFMWCRGLTKINIPASVQSIGDGAFVGCGNNLSISVAKENANYRVYNGCLMTKDCTMILRGINCDVSIPSSVTNIAEYAFYDCDELTSVEIPSSVTSIGQYAFEDCYGLMDVTIADGVEYIGEGAFGYCTALTSVTIPPSVKEIGIYAFGDCTSLTNVLVCDYSVLSMGALFSDCDEPVNPNLTIHTTENLLDRVFENIWPSKFSISGVPIVFDNYDEQSLRQSMKQLMMTKTTKTVLVVTNVVVHYIQTSEQSPMAAPITKDVGIVNVMTEIKGGNISIPESWAGNYSTFAAKFGSDFSDALIAETGKVDAGGKPMRVWQDYVAGTDPTDKDDVFKASVTIVEGVPVVSYTPTLSDAEAAKRKYTTWGKVKLQDEKWVEVKSGTEVDYNFFKVTVEMR